MTIPKGLRLVDAAPRLSAMGNAPNAVARLVINMGRSRCCAASITACSLSIPSSRFLLANSTISMPFFVTNPISIIIPIWEKILMVWSNSQRLNKAPANANGTVIMIVNGSKKLSNCPASTRYMRPSARKNAKVVLEELST